MTEKQVQLFYQSAEKAANYRKGKPEHQPRFVADGQENKGYPAFFHAENFVYTLSFYDFELTITKDVKEQLFDSVLSQFETFCQHCKSMGSVVPQPTPKEKLDPQKLKGFKGRLIFVDFDMLKKHEQQGALPIDFFAELRNELSKIFNVSLSEIAKHPDLVQNSAFDIAFGLACKTTGRTDLFEHFLHETCTDDDFRDRFVLMMVKMLERKDKQEYIKLCQQTATDQSVNDEYYAEAEKIYDRYCDEVASQDCDKTDYLEIDGKLIL